MALLLLLLVKELAQLPQLLLSLLPSLILLSNSFWMT
jgi:hypothetical protein